jgi:hypothetical protein
MRTIIAGGRDFLDYSLLTHTMLTLEFEVTEIVSGKARGADRLGEMWAEVSNTPIKLFPADWQQHGKSAGIIRNIKMAQYADALIAFWDGESRGTKHMIDTAYKVTLKNILVIRY